VKKLCLIISVAACVALPGFSQDGFDQIPGLLATDVMKADSLASEMNYAAIEAKDDEMLAHSYYWLGLTNYYMGRFYISSKYFRDAMATRGMQANQEFISSCWNNLGINYEYLGRIDDALEAYQRSLDIAKSEGDSVSIAQSWINLGLLEVKQQQLDRALSYFEDAEEWFGRIGDTLNVGLAIQNKGVAYKEMSDELFHSGQRCV
jgi:tetratricopeptide (TPR) repeat protein